MYCINKIVTLCHVARSSNIMAHPNTKTKLLHDMTMSVVVSQHVAQVRGAFKKNKVHISGHLPNYLKPTYLIPTFGHFDFGQFMVVLNLPTYSL